MEWPSVAVKPCFGSRRMLELVGLVSTSRTGWQPQVDGGASSGHTTYSAHCLGSWFRCQVIEEGGSCRVCRQRLAAPDKTSAAAAAPVPCRDAKLGSASSVLFRIVCLTCNCRFEHQGKPKGSTGHHVQVRREEVLTFRHRLAAHVATPQRPTEPIWPEPVADLDNLLPP